MVTFNPLNLPFRSTVTAVGRVKLARTNVGCDPSNRIRRSSPRPIARFVSVQKMNLKKSKIRKMQLVHLFHLTCWVSVFCAIIAAFSNFVEKAKACTTLVLETECCNISVILGYYFRPQSDGILTIERLQQVNKDNHCCPVLQLVAHNQFYKCYCHFFPRFSAYHRGIIV